MRWSLVRSDERHQAHRRFGSAAVIAATLTFVALAPRSAAEPDRPPSPREVTATVIGPPASRPKLGYNANYFDPKQRAAVPIDCAALFASASCPEDMVFVCSSHFRIAVCMERDLVSDPATGRPQGNMNLERCEETCAAHGRRLPTNNEWLVACTGTPPRACATYYDNHTLGPVQILSMEEGHVCNAATPWPGAGPFGTRCLTHPDALAMLPELNPECVSEAGVRGCVATLSQWVSHHPLGRGHDGFRTNGGSFAVRSAAVDYVTRAHKNTFYHFGSGCRCASDPSPASPTGARE